MAHIVIVIPCYNEEKRLDAEKLSQFTIPGHRLEFLMSNDGSTDGTQQVMEGLAARQPDKFVAHRLATNEGKAEAVRQGMQQALLRQPDMIGFWDADLATPLEEIPHFVQVMMDRPHIDMVFGSRVKLLGRLVERQPHRHYFGRVFATVVSNMLELAIYDTQCGAKLFRVTETLQRVLEERFITRWIFDVEIIARFKNLYHEAGIAVADRIYELPLREWRDVKGSKIGLKDAVRANFDLALIYRKYLAKP